jgi:hypothetical protein
MSKLKVVLTTILIGNCFVLSGCGRTLILKSPHAIRCDAPSELLNNRCSNPTNITNDITFEGLVDASRSDRQALRECKRSFEALQDSINRCNQAIDDLNTKIDQINAANEKTTGSIK